MVGDNGRVSRVLLGLFEEMRRLHFLLPNVESRITSQEEPEAHRRLVTAFGARDGDQAADIMRSHLNEVAPPWSRALVAFNSPVAAQDSKIFASYTGSQLTVRPPARRQLPHALIRPDGVLAWAATPAAPADMTALTAALRTWFGYFTSHASKHAADARIAACPSRSTSACRGRQAPAGGPLGTDAESSACSVMRTARRRN
jgi:hypothetical protein